SVHRAAILARAGGERPGDGEHLQYANHRWITAIDTHAENVIMLSLLSRHAIAERRGEMSENRSSRGSRRTPQGHRMTRWQDLRRRQGLVAGVFLLPAGFGFVVFYLWPALRGLWLSFTDYSLLRGSGELVGLQNYRDLAADALFWH